MKSLPYELIQELAKQYNFIKHLFKFNFTNILRYTDADIDVYYNNYWWYAYGIEFDSIRSSATSEVDHITLRINNVDKSFSNLIQTEEIRGKEVDIYEVGLDSNMNVLGSVLIFMGYIDSIEADHKRAEIQIYNHFILWKMKVPKRYHSPNCQWIFKSSQCGYSGSETWCDHSWERCVELNNKLNFGGFRWLPSIVDKQIWWGSVPKK